MVRCQITEYWTPEENYGLINYLLAQRAMKKRGIDSRDKCSECNPDKIPKMLITMFYPVCMP